VAFTGATGPVDFSYLQISSGGGLVVWSIVAPGGVSEYTVPDLAAVPSAASLGLVRGPITSFMYVARIEGFAYGRLRSGQLQSGAWSAYAVDALSGAY
jgi:hypothetical protein